MSAGGIPTRRSRAQQRPPGFVPKETPQAGSDDPEELAGLEAAVVPPAAAPTAPARVEDDQAGDGTPEDGREGRDEGGQSDAVPSPARKTRKPPARPTGELPDLRDARTRDLFARIPEGLVLYLDEALYRVKRDRPKTSRQDLLTALLVRYVRPADPAAVKHLHELLDDVDRARAPR